MVQPCQKTKAVKGVTAEMPITTVEKGPEKIRDAKKLLEALEKRFGRNAATKKTRRNLLEQQNKADLDTMTMDDLYNNLKVYEPEVKGVSNSSSSTQNMAFVSSSNNNTSSTNRAVNTAQVVNTAHRVSTASTQVNAAYFTNINNMSDAVICSFFASQPNSPQLVHEDLEQIRSDDMKEMDLRWQMAMLTMRARRFLKKTRMKLTVNVNETIRLDKSNVKWYNCHKRGYFARECRAPRNQDNKHKESSRRSVHVETSTFTALVSCDGLGGYHAEERPNYALMAFSSLSFDSEVSNDSTCLKSCLKTVKILKSQNDQLLKDLKKYELMVLDEFVNKPVVENCKAKSSEEEPKGNPQTDLQDQGVIDSGCSKHMTKNMSYLTDNKEIDGGYVAFEGNPKGGKITRKVSHKCVILRKVEAQLHAKVDDKKIIVTESYVRRDLRLANEEDEAVRKELGDILVRVVTTNSSLEAEQDSGGPMCQETIEDTITQTKFERVSKHSNDSLLARGNTLQSDEDRMKLDEMMTLCTNLQNRVLDLEQTKTTQKKEIASQQDEIASLKRRVKKLEKRNRSRTHKLKRLYKVGLSTRVESSGDEEGWDVLGGEEMFVAGQNENGVEEVVDVAQVSIAATTVTITIEEITLAQAFEALSTSKPKVKGIVFQEPCKSTTTTTIIYSQQSQDKGKGIMIEEPMKPKKKDQIRLNEEAAKKLQAEFDEEERLAREKAEKE
uniref:Uncharacterized protein n=1 Tax=Tanacetum cinerariifolium TaxID=118510 RepID=A0A6L2LUM5_TANCI|nr:hypothetical protein [Tanacetum cinerariifolium]